MLNYLNHCKWAQRNVYISIIMNFFIASQAVMVYLVFYNSNEMMKYKDTTQQTLI